MSLESMRPAGPAEQQLAPPPTELDVPNFIWMDITHKCQERCIQCYAQSGPEGTHGTMTEEDWVRVIDEAADLGIQRKTFIGGEPTLHPSLPTMINRALERGSQVEVYSNMAHITKSMWETLSQPGVSLATSFYSDKPQEHDYITQSRGSFGRIERNIARAVEMGIPIRAGMVNVLANQRTLQGKDKLIQLGLPEGQIGIDRKREVGRATTETEQKIGELCGKCTINLAIGPEGQAWPCVFSRWLVAGNVQEQSLEEILRSEKLRDIRHDLDREFIKRLPTADCRPADCDPYCSPQQGACQPDCTPTKNPCMPDLSQPCDPYDCQPTQTG